MTDREKAIVMAYTGICMLEGKKLFEFYKYLEELYERPVYTHEFLTLDIKERSEKDFMELCRREEPEQRWEQLTDKEQRIFLSAMSREEKVCKEVDEECRNCREPYEDSLVKTCLLYTSPSPRDKRRLK